MTRLRIFVIHLFLMFFLTSACEPESANVCQSDSDCDVCSRCINGLCEVQVERLNPCGVCGPDSLCDAGHRSDASQHDVSADDLARSDAWLDATTQDDRNSSTPDGSRSDLRASDTNGADHNVPDVLVADSTTRPDRVSAPDAGLPDAHVDDASQPDAMMPDAHVDDAGGLRVVSKRQLYSGDYGYMYASPDGDYVILSGTADGSQRPLTLLTVASGATMSLATDNSYDTKWAPGSGPLAYIDNSASNKILKLVSLPPGSPITLGQNVSAYDWVDDGHMLIFIDDDVDGTGGRLRSYTVAGGQYTTLDSGVTSIDLTQAKNAVVYARNVQNERADLWLALLPSLAKRFVASDVPVNTNGRAYSSLDLADSSDRMVYVHSADSYERGQLSAMLIPSGAVTDLATGVLADEYVNLYLSTDGLRVVYWTGWYNAWTVATTGGSPQQLGSDVITSSIPWRFRSDTFVFFEGLTQPNYNVGDLKRFLASAGAPSMIASLVDKSNLGTSRDKNWSVFQSWDSAAEHRRLYLFDYTRGLSVPIQSSVTQDLANFDPFNPDSTHFYFRDIPDRAWSGNTPYALYAVPVATPAQRRLVNARCIDSYINFTPQGDSFLYMYQDEDELEHLALATREGDHVRNVYSSQQVTGPYELRFSDTGDLAAMVFDDFSSDYVSLVVVKYRRGEALMFEDNNIRYWGDMRWLPGHKAVIYNKEGADQGLWLAEFE